MPSKTELPALYVRFIGSEPPTKQRVALLAAGFVAVVALVIFAVKMLGPKQAAGEGKQTPVLTVDVTPVSTIVAQRTLDVSGSVWAFDPIVIGSEVSGLRIETVNVEEGDFVRKGQVLATMNSSILRAQLARERARLKAMQANYLKALQPNRTYEIDGVKASFEQAKAVVAQEEWNISRAQANLKNARLQAQRYQALAKQGAVSAQDADNRNTSLEVAEAEVRTAQQRLQAARAAAEQAEHRKDMFVVGGRKEDVLAAAAAIEESKATIQQIESQIEQTIVRAPAAGMIIKRDAHIGEIATAMQMKALFNMIRDNRLEVRAQVPETDLPRLREGQTVQFTGPDGKQFGGTIRIITPQVDSETRLATLRIEVPFSRDLRPGIFVHGKVSVGTEPIMVIPTKSAVSRDDYTIAFTLDGDRVVAHTVRIGERFGDQVEVLSGLKSGDNVVVSGAGFLKDGDLVRVGK